MRTSKYLWKPSETECPLIRLRTNRISFKNLYRWRVWWELFTKERQQCVASRINSKTIIECTVYGTRECSIVASGLKVRGIPKTRTCTHLCSCEFVDENGCILAHTQEINSVEPNIDNFIQSIDLLSLYLHGGQQYMLRENTHCDNIGITSPYPWITIADSSGKDFMGAGYCYAPGLVDDLFYVPHYQSNMDLLLLGILAYYACESELYRQPN